MQSPEAKAETAPTLDDGSAPKKAGPVLKLVKKSAHLQDLTPLEREFLPPLLAIQESPPSPVHRQVLWTIIGLVIALVLWASIGKIEIVATAPGKFIPDGRVKEVQPLESAIVKAVHVKEGDLVREGDLLIELDPTLNAAELAANNDKYGFNRLEQARLTAELGASTPAADQYGQSAKRVTLENQMRHAREQSHATKLAAARAAVQEKTAALAAAKATLIKYQETTQISQERESSARSLVDSGAISRVDYLQLKQDLAQNSNDLAAQEKSVQQATAAVDEAERALEQVQRDRVADIYNDLDQRVANEPALKGDLDKSKELFALKWLRAPVSGRIQKIDVTTIGQVVSAGQSLVTIVPNGTPLVIEATVTNEDIGFVKVGQPVEVKVDTFPFQKYGSLRGTLIAISPDAEDKDSASKDSGLRRGSAPKGETVRPTAEAANVGYVYKVRIRTQSNEFIVEGAARPVQAGMTAQADITTDRRRVIEFFLSPVTKYLDEGLKVR
jgi:hemolysin D